MMSRCLRASLAGILAFDGKEAGMTDNISSWRTRSLGGGDENGSSRQAEGTIAISRLRAVAAEAGLVASVDGSLGVLVNLWARDEQLHPHLAHRSSGRRTN
jgi:hypothetical protein